MLWRFDEWLVLYSRAMLRIDNTIVKNRKWILALFRQRSYSIIACHTRVVLYLSMVKLRKIFLSFRCTCGPKQRNMHRKLPGWQYMSWWESQFWSRKSQSILGGADPRLSFRFRSCFDGTSLTNPFYLGLGNGFVIALYHSTVDVMSTKIWLNIITVVP